jgi:glucose-6-phosphate dehydrogenase assembly protein OpcA
VETAVSAGVGSDVRVDYASIEKSLAELWRSERSEGEGAVTRAALWNVVAHTSQPRHHAQASEVLGRASAAVPQRTIVVRAQPNGAAEIASWISANCHVVGGGKQVCSEEVAIVAGGDRVERVPPLVNALLIPDMPVAVWWVGDLPAGNESYVETLLEPADRLIVDSSHFDSPADLSLVSRIARQTTTAPADLNWARLEEWRAATAMLFDPQRARARLPRIRLIRVVACSTQEGSFGDSTESLLYSAWLTAQAGLDPDSGAVEYDLITEPRAIDHGSLCRVEITFQDGSVASIARDDERNVVVATMDGTSRTLDSVTRVLSRGIDALIVRQLKRPEADRVYIRTLPLAALLGEKLS